MLHSEEISPFSHLIVSLPTLLDLSHSLLSIQSIIIRADEAIDQLVRDLKTHYGSYKQCAGATLWLELRGKIYSTPSKQKTIRLKKLSLSPIISQEQSTHVIKHRNVITNLGQKSALQSRIKRRIFIITSLRRKLYVLYTVCF